MKNHSRLRELEQLIKDKSCILILDKEPTQAQENKYKIIIINDIPRG